MKNKINKFQIGLLIVNILYLILFTFLYLEKKNYEFLLYIGAVSIILILLVFLHFRYNFSNLVLIGMSIWGLLHMLGGYVIIGENVLYAYMIFPFLRFDQFVHAFGFGFATILSYDILKNYFDNKDKLVLFIFLIFIGMGLGSLNEIIEFIAVKTVPETGVGGYDNTMMDIIFNTIGAIIAVFFINIREKTYTNN